MEFEAWLKKNVLSKNGDHLTSWRPVLEEFYPKIKFQNLLITKPLKEEYSKHDWSFWLERAMKRENSEVARYDIKADKFRGLGLFIGRGALDPDAIDEDFAYLPLTPKSSKRALFLDRDGIINVDEGYVYKIEDVSFVPGIENLISFCNEKGITVIVLTNQSGIGRGYYKEEDVLKLHEWMNSELDKLGAKVDAWYFSPFHPESEDSTYKRVSITRKPRPGMALRAAYEHSLDLSRSAMMGDKVSDILSHIDLHTVLFKGNYELGNYKDVVSNHEESLLAFRNFYSQ